jgi:hypothetical protein
MTFRLVTKERFTCEFSEELYCSIGEYTVSIKIGIKLVLGIKDFKLYILSKFKALEYIVNTEKHAPINLLKPILMVQF